MHERIEKAIAGLRQFRESHQIQDPRAINYAIAVLHDIEAKADDVVESCLNGHSQEAERFAYNLSGSRPEYRPLPKT